MTLKSNFVLLFYLSFFKSINGSLINNFKIKPINKISSRFYHQMIINPKNLNFYQDNDNNFPSDKKSLLNSLIRLENNISNSESKIEVKNNQQILKNSTFGIKLAIAEDNQHNKLYNQYLKEKKTFRQNDPSYKKMKSENFEAILDLDFTFNNIGGYDNIKKELIQISDILINYEKYKDYNIRIPKGIILEGPPGNGKTILAKGFSGTLGIPFIATSGSSFQEKYVGIGASRIRELFNLAEKNIPCIIFIDEIDALTRHRGELNDGSGSERDSTLNELLTKLDGFKRYDGVFIVCATNRIDLLDKAFIRPGRIDKKIYIGNPDAQTRKKIINIHITGKPHEKNIDIDNLVEQTNGMSGAEIENILNEAMLHSLRNNGTIMKMKDIEFTLARCLSGYQDSPNIYSNDMIRRIAIHELGHGISGLLLKSHSKMSSVNLNLWSPKTPGYTVFETEEIDANIFTKEKLFAHLVVLLSGRVAEQIFFNASVTTGASHDLEQALKLAKNMIVDYNMGEKSVYSYNSDKFKEIADEQVKLLLDKAEEMSRYLINHSKDLISEFTDYLIEFKKIKRETFELKIYRKYSYLHNLEL